MPDCDRCAELRIAEPEGPQVRAAYRRAAYLRHRFADTGVDCAIQVVAKAGRRKKILIADMDSTIIGQECIDELADMVGEGHRAAMVFLVQRPDCSRLSLAADIDPTYAAAFEAARSAGVEVYAIGCDVRLDGIDAVTPVEIVV